MSEDRHIFAQKPKSAEEYAQIYAQREHIKAHESDVANYAAHAYTENKGSKPSSVFGIVLALFSFFISTLALALFAMSVFYPELFHQSKNSTSVNDNSGYYNGNSIEFEQTSIAKIVSKLTPAVVSITSEIGQSTSGLFGAMGGGQAAAGTGVIVSSDGYILTNKHVIKGAKNITVITDAGDSYKQVEVVAVDPLNDFAYLKIKGAHNLPTVKLGDSKTITVGQPVLAIGNALGAFQNTVTQGIVSGLGRSVAAGSEDNRVAEKLTDMIQTDAAINPGNSGGPLVNAAGEVIGINTAVSSDAQGLGFAIPISAARGMLKSVLDGKTAARAFLGLSYVPITPAMAKAFKLPVREGALVTGTDAQGNRTDGIIKGGPAERAGIKNGDVIVRIGAVKVGRAGSVSTLVGEYEVGDEVDITLLRDGKEQSVKATLDACPVK